MFFVLINLGSNPNHNIHPLQIPNIFQLNPFDTSFNRTGQLLVNAVSCSILSHEYTNVLTGKLGRRGRLLYKGKNIHALSGCFNCSVVLNWSCPKAPSIFNSCVKLFGNKGALKPSAVHRSP